MTTLLTGGTNRCRCPLTILQAAVVLGSVALVGMNCCSSSGQEKQPSKPQPAADSHSDPLSHQIADAEANLRKLREQVRSNDPNVVQPQKELEVFFALENRLLQLSQGEQNEATKAEIANVTAAIARTAAQAQAKYVAGLQPEQTAQSQQLEQMKDQLADREKKIATLAKQMMEQQRRPTLPSLENGTLKIYKLSFAPARDAAQTIDSLFGAQTLRLAVDERSNTLIVYSKPDSVTALDALMTRLDEQAAAAAGPDKAKQGTAATPRSLLLRVFWLADGLPEGTGQKPDEFLPESVLKAATKLGLVAPRLVTQTVNSLALGREDTVDFSTNVPAVLFEQPVGLNCQGRIKLASDDRVRLEMGVHVGGPTINCELNGSLATPLGHYMVLGTANSIMSEGGVTASAMGGGPGMMGPGGMGRGGEFGPGPGGGFRGGAGSNPNYGARGPGGGGPEGAPAPGAGPSGESPGAIVGGQQPPGKQNFNTSRFAFVVQVIEGQSYPAEKDRSSSK
jgi:hypothetical protein